MLSLSSASLLIKNKLIDTGSWLILLDLTSPDTLTKIRICSNTSDIIRDGELYAAFPFELEELTEQLAGELPTLSLKVSNVNRLIQGYLEQDDALGSGWEVLVQVVHSTDSQNILKYSEEFSNTYWTKFNCTVITDDTSVYVDPFGNTNAYELIDDGVHASSVLSNTGEVAATNPNNSIYLKQADTDTAFRLGIQSVTQTTELYRQVFNFTGGVLTAGAVDIGSATINLEPLSNGWYRVDLLSGTWVDEEEVAINIYPTDGTAINTRLLVFGGQIADTLKEYIPTSGIAIVDNLVNEPELVTRFTTLTVASDQEWVNFQIGMANPLRIQVPRIKYLTTFCQNTYKSGGCNYSGGLPSCAKSLADCEAHFASDAPLPFLGFPGIVNATIYTS